MTNDDMGNQPFSEKKIALKDNSFQATAMISNYEDWDISSVEDRQQILANLAVKAWEI